MLRQKTTSFAERVIFRRSSLKAVCIKIWDPLRDDTKVNFHFHVCHVYCTFESQYRKLSGFCLFKSSKQHRVGFIFFIYKFYIQQINNYRLFKTFVWFPFFPLQQLTTVLSLYHTFVFSFNIYFNYYFSNVQGNMYKFYSFAYKKCTLIQLFSFT